MKLRMLAAAALLSVVIAGCGAGADELSTSRGASPSRTDAAELLGKDADGNGVRDDVDRLVAKDIAAMPHAVSPHAKVSLQRLALFMSQALVADLNDPVLVRALAEDQQLAVACVGELWRNAFGNDDHRYRETLTELEAAILNTRKRYKADRAFWMATASMAIGDDYYAPCEEVPRHYPWPVPSWAAVKAVQTVQ